jgi:hypothetical protein
MHGLVDLAGSECAQLAGLTGTLLLGLFRKHVITFLTLQDREISKNPGSALKSGHCATFFLGPLADRKGEKRSNNCP